jgi:thymidylate synthase
MVALHDVEVTLGPGTRSTADVDEAFVYTLNAVLTDGHRVDSGSADGSSEILDFQIAIANARDRVLANPARPLNLVSAVARFVWMLSASDRLSDIAFYEPKVLSYTDNQVSVPGSNYGMRMFQPRPGLDQIRGVIGKLREDAGTRRAATVIWAPEDAVRLSNDIPCAFGTFYHLRDGSLITTTILRSNNAFRLFPYNVFEFGLVGEMIASELLVPVGSYVHFSASMHVYDRDRNNAEDAVNRYRSRVVDLLRSPMPQMPSDPSPLEQANKLVRLEAELRNNSVRVMNAGSEALAALGTGELHEYWLPFYRVLLVHVLRYAGRIDDADSIVELLPQSFAEAMRQRIDPQSDHRKLGTGVQRAEDLLPAQLPLVQPTESSTPLFSRGPVLPLSAPGQHLLRARVARLCCDIALDTHQPISEDEFQFLFTWADSIVAERSSKSPGRRLAGDQWQVSREDIEVKLKDLRGG